MTDEETIKRLLQEIYEFDQEKVDDVIENIVKSSVCSDDNEKYNTIKYAEKLQRMFELPKNLFLKRGN
jgi:hypothetical protein